jgi:hypothetical protein
MIVEKAVDRTLGSQRPPPDQNAHDAGDRQGRDQGTTRAVADELGRGLDGRSKGPQAKVRRRLAMGVRPVRRKGPRVLSR